MILPFTIRREINGANGRNWPGFVILNPDAERPAAVWAQEAFESRYKLNPIDLILRFLSPSIRQAMEIMGHEIEVQVCNTLYGQNANDARWREAMDMSSGYDGLFSNLTREQIFAKMKTKEPQAIHWVAKHILTIKKWV